MTPQQTETAWWWRGSNGHQGSTRVVSSSETELLSAAVLCSALSTTKASPSASDALANARAARELEMHVRKSPLPHSLKLPVLELTTDYVLVESEGAVICALQATNPSDIVQAVVGSAVPLSQPYMHRFGGSRVHAPFWKRARRLDLTKLYAQAQRMDKVLLLCGHSIGGSIAKLAFCELVYTRLPQRLREVLGKIDAEQSKAESNDHDHKERHFRKHKKHKNEPVEWMTKTRESDRETALQNLPAAMVVCFGAPYAGDLLTRFLEPLGMHDRVVTFVNEFDCIPGILNIAHSAAMLAKTTERLVTIAKATKALLNLLPGPMQQRIVDMTKTAGSSSVPSATSAYLSMSITMLQKSFDKLREFNVVKTVDYRYAPCGSYIFMAKQSAEFNIFSDPMQIRKALGEDGDEATASLTGNSILQHMMSAYVDAITRRSRSIQINATMNHYERLGVARNASDREIRLSYRSLALRWHPDRIAHGSLTEQQKEVAEDIFKLLAESYEVLSSEEGRSAYDAFLNRPPSRREEFMQYGTVDGISLDEAISTFKDAVDGFTGTLHRVTDRFSSSSSTSVGHSLQRNAGKTQGTTGGNTPSSNGPQTSSTNIPVTSDSASTAVPSSTSTSPHVPSGAPVASTGTVSTSNAATASSNGVSASTSEASATLGKTGEIVTNNNAGTSTQVINTRSSSDSVSSSTNTGLKTVSVVGGAVAVAASVAIIVSAWSQFSDASRKKRQAAAVRDMSGDCLVLLLEDRKTVQQRHSRTPSIELLQQSKVRKIKAFAIASSPASTGRTSDRELFLTKEAQQAIVELTQQDQEQDDDDKLIENFFDCTAEDENAAVEAMVEEEFFDCVELVQDVDQHFARKHEKLRHPQLFGTPKARVMFPRGSRVNTPFGVGVVEDWRENTAVAAIRFEDESLRYIEKKEITRGAVIARELISKVAEKKRAELAERVIAKYELEDTKTGDHLTNVAIAGAGGAVDSGLRAAGGLALANGVARTGTTLGGMVAAPLAVASILVDIGKEFYDYRKKHTERKDLGVLSATSERLMRRDFRLKTGEVVVSRTTAAAGAGLSAYGVVSAMTLWAAAGVATGPIGIVAATSAAVVGGVAGYFGGTKIYSMSTASYFKSQKHAKEHIDRLELGARVLFEEYDPEGTGEISKEACLLIMQKLYEVSGGTSDFAYEASVKAITDFDGPVTWRMFWVWVSTEAARSLKSLDIQESQPCDSERKRDKVARKIREAKENHDKKHHALPSPGAEESIEVEKEIHARAAFEPILPGEEDKLEDVKATVEALVHSRYLTAGQAFSLYSQLDSSDPVEQVSAREIIDALQFESATTEPEYELFPMPKSDLEKEDEAAAAANDKSMQLVSSQPTSMSKLPPLAPSSNTQKKKKSSKPPQVDPRLDVMCSLMSVDGLQRFLATQFIVPEDETIARHEDLHCLALASAMPPASSSASRDSKVSK